MPPPLPQNVYPCLDWVPRGVAKAKPDRLKLTGDELKTVIAQAKSKALEARRRLGQVVREEDAGTVASSGPQGVEMESGCSTRIDNSNNNNNGSISSASNNKKKRDAIQNDDDDDVIMREYGLDTYDDENEGGIENNNAHNGDDADMSENEAEDGITATRGTTRGLAEEIATLTYHASNDEDPYLREQGASHESDEDEDDNELIIKPTDNLIVAGHVSKEESSIEVYVYDNVTHDSYLHHDIIQSDYPCCVRWIGHVRNQARNIAAAGYMNPDIYLWDLDVVDVLEPLETLVGHSDAVIDICWNSQAKNIIASGSADKHVRLWNLDECKSISNIKLTGKVSALEFGIYEQFQLLAGDLNKNVSVIDTRLNTVTNKWHLKGEVEKVRWVPADHSKFLVSDDLGYVYCFDIGRNDEPVVKFRAHEISVTGLEFSPKCDDMLVTASADDAIKVWDTKQAFKTSTKAKGVEPVLIKELADLKVGNILSLRICPNSLGMIAVGGDSKCNSFKTYDLTLEKEVSDRFLNQPAA